MLLRIALIALSLAPARAAEIDWKAWAAETKTLLVEAIKVDTINPPGNEEALCKKFAELLKKDGIDAKVLVSAPGRGNLIARLAGSGGGGGPVLFMAHLDVVGIKGQAWTMPALGAHEKDGYLYGRGAIDDKGMAVLGVQVMRLIKRSGAALKRDLVLALTADEESSAKYGLAWILKNHPGAVKAEFAINEGGQIIHENGKVRFVEVQTAEKVYLDLRLETSGPSGHSSVPVPENAIYRLARALVKLSGKQFPIQLDRTTRTMLEGLVKAGGPEAPLLRQLLAGGRPAVRAGRRLAELPHFNSVLRTTFVATMLEGGTRVNVLPSGATANVNCRVLPGMDLRAVIKQIEAWVDDPKVKVVYSEEDLETAHASPVKHALFDAIRKVSKDMFPGSVVMPVMSPGATDSRFLRQSGIPAYGLLPFPMTRDDDRRMHAADERIPLASFEPGLRFTYAMLMEVLR